MKKLFVLSLASSLAGCGYQTILVACGEGTHVEDEVCVPDGDLCGPGTHLDGGECVANDPGAAACGAGTHLEGNECVANDPGAAPCGPGTHEDNGQCLPNDPGAPPCGPGTHEENNQCVPDKTPCGPGTSEQGGQCLPDGTQAGPGYYVLAATAMIPADGITKVPVQVHAIDADGAPVLADVVLGLSKLGAGSFSSVSLELTATGGETYFTPCNSAQAPGCSGDFQIELYLASDTSTVVAKSQTLTLIEPQGVGSPGPCEVSGNVIFFDGDAGDYIHPGVDTIKVGNWGIDGNDFHIHVGVDPSDSSQGLWWDIDFSSQQIGQPLTTQVYEGAERWPFEPPGHPGLDVSGDGKGCNMLTGRFQIHDLVKQGGTVTSILATFEQHCEGGTPALRGCVHYEN